MRFLKHIVAFCIGFTALSYIACFVAAWNGVDVAYIAYYVSWTFGGELLMTCILKIFDRKYVPTGERKTPEK